VQALRSNAVDDAHVGVRFASLLGTHTKGLRERFVRVNNPVISPPFLSCASQLPGQHTTNSSTDLRSSGNTHLETLMYPSDSMTGARNSDLMETSADDLAGASGESFYANGEMAENQESHLSGRDWLALPFDLSNESFENDYMQPFFGFDPVEACFFWDVPP